MTDGLNTRVAKTDTGPRTETYAVQDVGEVTFDRYGFRQDIAEYIEEPLTEHGRAVVPLVGSYDPDEPEPGYTVDASVVDIWLGNLQGNVIGTPGGNPLDFLRAFFEEDGNAIFATVKDELTEGVPQATHVPLDYLDTELGWTGVVYHAPADKPVETHRDGEAVPVETEEDAYTRTRAGADADGATDGRLFDDAFSAEIEEWEE